MYTTLQNPLETIKSQRLYAQIDTDEKSYFETEICLCEYDEISFDVDLELNLEYDPDYKQSYVTKIKAHLLSAYDARECEDVELTKSEKKIIEKYISENLTIKIN